MSAVKRGMRAPNPNDLNFPKVRQKENDGEERGRSVTKRPCNRQARTKQCSRDDKYDVEEVLACRLQPNTNEVVPQVLIKWKNFDSKFNTWEPIENFHKNTVFEEYFNTRFKHHETDIYVDIANIKERLKRSIREAIRENFKFVNMPTERFDPYLFKVHQVFPYLIKEVPQKFQARLEELVFQNYFFKRDADQRAAFEKIAATMAQHEQVQVTVVNEMDFEHPPSFEYITKNYIVNDFEQMLVDAPVEASKPMGCSCGPKKCSLSSSCCPQLCKEPFAYRRGDGQSIIRLGRQEAIIECGDGCKCDETCVNRGTQHPRNITLCLFRTMDRGWGIKNGSNREVIKHGTFIIEYTGELLGHHEASKRRVTSYLFDLNMERRSHGFYTIDAFKYGNLARFVNHSCDPNSSIWFINDCRLDPKNQRLCIFAERDIKPQEEITIDYNPKDEVPTTDALNYSKQFLTDCNCGSNICRGILY